MLNRFRLAPTGQARICESVLSSPKQKILVTCLLIAFYLTRSNTFARLCLCANFQYSIWACSSMRIHLRRGVMFNRRKRALTLHATLGNRALSHPCLRFWSQACYISCVPHSLHLPAVPLLQSFLFLWW
jgi:hypothetical protein